MRSLRTQLVVSHLLLVLLMGLVMGGAIFTFFGLSQSVDRILQGNFKTVLAAERMRAALHDEEVAILLYRAGDGKEARSLYQRSVADFDRALVEAEATIDSVEERQILEFVAQDERRARAVVQTLLQEGAPNAQAEAVVENVLRPTLRRLREFSGTLREQNERNILEDYLIATGNAQEASWRSLAITVGALFLAVLLGLRMVREALTPLAILAKRAEAIASGDLDQEVKLPRRDEIGALADSFNQMANKLAEVRRSEVRRLQRAEQMSDAALESLYDPVVVTDAKRRIVHLNRAAEGLFGQVPDSPRKPVAEHIPDRRIVRAIESAITRETVSASEDEAALIPIQVGDAQRTYRLRATPMKDDNGHLLGSVTVLEDITHLREVDHLKSEFIGVASHELRTPVTSLMLSNQLLLEGAVGDVTDGQRELLTAQQDDLNRLEKLMRDLLDVTRLEGGSSPPRFEVVRPIDLLRSPVNGLQSQADNKGVALTWEADIDLPAVRADRGQIGRVLTNLISNAIRHTPSGGAVRAVASASENHVTFRVEDSGEGIPEDYLAHIFERFVQVPGATGGGAGLGLSIAHSIVKAHGGEMTVSSEVGRGSTFMFTLPIEPAPSGEESTL